MPRHRWMPCPNPTIRLGRRLSTKASGSTNSRGSRLALANSRHTRCPARLTLMTGAAVEELVHPTDEHRRILGREAAQQTSDHHGDRCCVVANGVEGGARLDAVEVRAGHGAHVVLENRHAAGLEMR